MTKLSLIALPACLMLSLSCLAQAPAPNSPSTTAPPLDAATSEALVRLGGQLMLAGKAYEYDRVLADDIGPRLTASPNYVKAADWAVSEFTRLGLSNVHRESWEITDSWEPETWATARILVPHEQRLHLESDGWSPSTPHGGVRGRVYHLSALTPEAIKAESPQIKDTLVLIDQDTVEKSGPFLFGKFLDGIALLADEGARGLLLGIGAVNNVPSMAGLTCCNGKVASLPVANVGLEDTLLLGRLLERGPVEVEFSFTNRVREHAKVDNVVAEIPGSDPGGEYVIIGGHLDSWQLGTGAEDNGTGAATVLAVAQAVKASGVQPRRTLRFILFGGEEEGLLGSIHYAREHKDELDKCAGVFITDTGSEPPKGWYVFGRDDEKAALAPLKPVLSSLDAAETTDEGRFTFSTDHGPFLIHGVPSFVLWNPVDKYMQLHHKPSDTFDKVDHRDLNLGAAVVGVTALAFADAPTDLKHLSQADMEEQLKKIKAFDEYQDMESHHMF
jgi:carboxypeptidase Q